MYNNTNLSTFGQSFKQLKKNFDMKFFIHFYHHNANSEPFLHIDGYIENLSIERVDEHGFAINILTHETILVFTEQNYFSNISGESVVFSSKHDDGTHCIIEFG